MIRIDGGYWDPVNPSYVMGTTTHNLKIQNGTNIDICRKMTLEEASPFYTAI